MWLISRNVGKRFAVSSQSPGGTLLTAHSKSYVVGVVTFSNPCRMFVEEFSECPLECHTCRRVGLPNLTTRAEVFMNVFSFLRLLDSSGCVGFSKLDDES
ncbi:hypothetical protein H5410_040481 [Solanum commersonii]|uniref:Uncharacterized protein n=1 Tax=Solanum commersonii TaxID=4109 RepID=A0A9J5XR12_SOLCO|nr:hypothetical protein H5410_040481 [Solanum commersonii]